MNLSGIEQTGIVAILLTILGLMFNYMRTTGIGLREDIHVSIAEVKDTKSEMSKVAGIIHSLDSKVHYYNDLRNRIEGLEKDNELLRENLGDLRNQLLSDR